MYNKPRKMFGGCADMRDSIMLAALIWIGAATLVCLAVWPVVSGEISDPTGPYLGCGPAEFEARGFFRVEEASTVSSRSMYLTIQSRSNGSSDVTCKRCSNRLAAIPGPTSVLGNSTGFLAEPE